MNINFLLMKTKYTLLAFLFISVINLSSLAQTSSLVSVDCQGNLIYSPDANGNRIPDFSMVGYHQGEKPIPDVAVQIILNPGFGDRYADIQNAIDAVATMSPDRNGHRGAILLRAGYYAVSQTLNITTSGIVIREEGKGC